MSKDRRPVLVWGNVGAEKPPAWMGDFFMERAGRRNTRWSMKQQRVRERRALGTAAGKE